MRPVCAEAHEDLCLLLALGWMGCQVLNLHWLHRKHKFASAGTEGGDVPRVIFNPFVHATTITVHSTGACMYIVIKSAVFAGLHSAAFALLVLLQKMACLNSNDLLASPACMSCRAVCITCKT